MTNPINGVVTAKMTAMRALTMNDMTMAPTTMNGERSSSRRPRFTPACTWLISAVTRVISVGAPTRSMSA